MENAATISATLAPSAVIERDAFTAAMEIVTKAVETRNSIPVLDNVRLQGSGSHITMTATNLDIEIQVKIAAAVDSRLDTTAAASNVLKLLKNAPKAYCVALEQYPTYLKVEFEKARYSLPTIAAEDFPIMNAPDLDSVSFDIDGSTLYNAFHKTSGAISTEETRYYLNGIFVHTMADVLTFVATDGHRLYRQNVGKPEEFPTLPLGLIVPARVVKLMEALLKGKNAPRIVTVTVDDSKSRRIRFAFEFEFGDVVITAKTIDGTFPDYQRVIPDMVHSADFALFEADELAEAVKSVLLIASDKGRAFKLSLGKSESKLHCNNPDNGSASADIPAHWSGDEFEIGFNGKYVLEAIATHGGGELRIGFRDAGSPSRIYGRDGWTAVLMPMRV
jgi:DNA polymerase-3 subunit beta